MFLAAPGEWCEGASARLAGHNNRAPKPGRLNRNPKGYREKAGASVDVKAAANKSDKPEATKGRASYELKRYMCVG